METIIIIAIFIIICVFGKKNKNNEPKKPEVKQERYIMNVTENKNCAKIHTSDGQKIYFLNTDHQEIVGFSSTIVVAINKNSRNFVRVYDVNGREIHYFTSMGIAKSVNMETIITEQYNYCYIYDKEGNVITSHVC